MPFAREGGQIGAPSHLSRLSIAGRLRRWAIGEEDPARVRRPGELTGEVVGPALVRIGSDSRELTTRCDLRSGLELAMPCPGCRS